MSKVCLTDVKGKRYGLQIVLFEIGGLEVATSVEENPDIDPAVLESYYQALNSLKEMVKQSKPY
jgi:hypothetical protein